jgi:hypothetical protein
MHVGCIPGRKLSVLVTVHNRSKQTITLLGGEGPQPFPRVIKRVAVQVRLAPPPPNGDLAVSGLRSWNARPSPSALIPPDRDAWVQSNFLMSDCDDLRLVTPVTVNRTLKIVYIANGARGAQTIAVPAAQIILTRGPIHPRLPVNQVG